MNRNGDAVGHQALDFPILDRDPGNQSILHDRERLDESVMSCPTDDLGDFATEFVERSRDRPFFMYLAFTAPHSPMHATDADLARIATIEDERRRANAAMTFATRAFGVWREVTCV